MSSSNRDQEEGASHIRRPLTWSQRLGLAALIPVILGKLAGSLLLRTYRDPGTPFRRRLLLAVSSLSNALPVEYVQALMPTTESRLRKHFASPAQSDWVHTEVVLRPRGFRAARLHVIVPRKSGTDNGTDNTNETTPSSSGAGVRAPVLLDLHGGGYLLPISAAQIDFSAALAKELGVGTTCILEYTLTPLAKYPTQLAQASAALSYLVQEMSVALDEIIVVGDSAGGNLALGLLAHLANPHPDIDPVPSTSTTSASHPASLAGALAISPRCINGATSDSYRRNLHLDIISPTSTAQVMKVWQPRDEVWAASNADPEAWQKPGGVRARHLMLVGGEHESFIDDIADFAKIVCATSLDKALATATERQAEREPGMQEDIETRVFFEGKAEIHDQPMLDYANGKHDGESTLAIMTWAGGIMKPALRL